MASVCVPVPEVEVIATLGQTVSPLVSLGVKPHLGTRNILMLLSDSCSFSSIWGVLLDERTDLPFTAVTISSTCHLLVYLQFYISAFYMASHFPNVRFLVYACYLQFYI
jgi:hypothetical protein